MPDGGTAVGAPERKESSRLVLLLAACGSPTDHRNRIRGKGQQHLPRDEAWLIGEHRMSGEKKYYLANPPANTDLRTLAAAIKARWICEQAHQQMKEELALDHFEG
jgi:SRSO17 transposase